jgi:hypothetical protein
MKKIFFSAAMSLFLVCSTFAQDPYPYKNALKISPIEFAQSKFQVTYERYIKNRSQSILLIPAVIMEEDGRDTKQGVEAMLQYRFFLTNLRKGVNKSLGFYNIGFYAGPYALGLLYQEDYVRDIYDPIKGVTEVIEFEKEVQSLEGGVVLGVQFDITSRILLDIFVGGGVRQSDVTDTFEAFDYPDGYYYEPIYQVFDREYTGVKPKLGLQLGFSF